MIIRQDQIVAMRAMARRQFVREMVGHLADFSPLLFKAVGEDQFGRAIGLGIERAAGYGFESRGAVRLYLELMLLFGSHFDTDPQYRWAAEILADRGAGLEMERAEFLYRRTMNYRRSVAGPDDKYTLSALRNIQLEARRPLPSDGDDIAAHLRQRIRAICPEKATYLGTDAINALIGTGMATAQQRAIATDRGIALVVVLMLAFGHGCTDDPLYPWIGRTLSDPAITDPVSRANRLERKALVWLEHVLAHLYRSGTT